MMWLWVIGPLLVVGIWFATAWPDRRRSAEVERWRASMGPKTPVVTRDKGLYRGGKEKKQAPPPPRGARRAGALPGPLQRLVNAAGGGVAEGHFELAKDLAYLSVMSADLQSGSDLQAISAKLEDAAPSFTARPLPIIEGERMPNTGVEFKKDPEFMGLFLVEPAGDLVVPVKPGAAPPPKEADPSKAIRAFLSRPVRDALRELPEAWLFVQGKAMAIVVYGSTTAEKLNELVTLADAIFAEYGAGGGPSLMGDDDDETASDTDDEEEAAPAPAPAPAKKSKPAAAAPPKGAKGKIAVTKGMSTKD